MCSTPLQHLFMRNMWELGVNSFLSHIVSISLSISIPLIFSSLKNVLCGTQHRKDSRSLLPVESSSDRITQALHVEPKPTGRGAVNINLTCRSLYIPIICNTFSDFLWPFFHRQPCSVTNVFGVKVFLALSMSAHWYCLSIQSKML